MAHAATHPPRCAICMRFIAWDRSRVVREYSGTQMHPDCDDIEVGTCPTCTGTGRIDHKGHGTVKDSPCPDCKGERL